MAMKSPPSSMPIYCGLSIAMLDYWRVPFGIYDHSLYVYIYVSYADGFKVPVQKRILQRSLRL